MSDTSDNSILSNSIQSPVFQDRCYLRFIAAAIAATTEVTTATVNSSTAAGNPTLHFASTPAGIIGYTVADLTAPTAITANTTISSVTATSAVMNVNAAGAGVGAADVVTFSPAFHTQRLALAGTLFNGGVGRDKLCEIVLSNTTNRTNCIANPQTAGGNILDSDIDFQISSIFTGMALARSWT